MSEETSTEKRTPGSLHPDCSTADRATYLVNAWRAEANGNREYAKKLEAMADQLETCAYELEGRIDTLEKRHP